MKKKTCRLPYSYLYFPFADIEIVFIVDKHSLQCQPLSSRCVNQEHHGKPSCKTRTKKMLRTIHIVAYAIPQNMTKPIPS